MTVNITCNRCDGRRLCEACRSAARTLAAAGCRVEHSTRYAALRAAAMGTYGFDACIIPVAEHERGIVDAATALLSGKRVLIVADVPATAAGDLSPDVAILSRERYAAGDFNVSWLSTDRAVSGDGAADETARLSESATTGPIDAVAERAIATRRLKRVADSSRVAVARADLPAAPRMDLVAVLEDEIAWARASGSGFGIVLVHLPGLSVTKAGDAKGAVERRLSDAQSIIGSAVRTIDVVAARADDYLVVLPEANETGTRIVADRIAAAVERSALRASVKPRAARGFAAWSIGRALYPGDGNSRVTLLARATATLVPIVRKRGD